MTATASFVNGFAPLFPYEVEASEELADAVSFIEADYTPEDVVRAGYVAGVVSLLPASVVFLTPAPTIAALALMAIVPLSVIQVVHEGPMTLAALSRTEALGETPTLIGRAVLRMEIQPTLENSVRFAADNGEGPLADSLSEHIDRAVGTPHTGLLSFAEEWAEHFPALRRSSHLLVTAEDAPEGERVRTLERSLQAVLDGTRNQMAEFTAAIRGPTTALYAFGVLLPMALVALIPVGGFVDLPIGVWFFVVTYNVVLPLCLALASVWLLVRRPVAFPPPKVRRDHPDVPDRLYTRALGGLAAGIGFFAVAVALGEPELGAVGGLGFALGVGLVLSFHPIRAVRNYVRDVEEHLVDALYLVGRQVSEGESVESAVDLAADRVPGATGEVFEGAAGLQRRLHIGVEESFLGEYGALRGVPSPRAHGTARLLSVASHEGQPAGRAIVSMADHLEELAEVEAETKRQLEKVTSTLEHTAAFFGPLIGGATVGLGSMMTGEGAEQMGEVPIDPTQLGVVVGVFVITLCLILTPLSIALRHGIDRAMIGYHVGRSLAFAMPIYVATILAVSLIG